MRYLLPILILIQIPAYAKLDGPQTEALQQTKHLLKNPSARQKAADRDPKAKDADNKVSALAGSTENKEEIYDLASQLMEKIVKETNGDPEKMQKLMLEAQSNPEAFYKKYFNKDQQAKVRGIATKITADSPKIDKSK